ncbi:Transcriptional regulator, AraC family protein [Minicystis rosea]|nr:Transcriptional regulator, AraC family protein [Minicystis rosea]
MVCFRAIAAPRSGADLSMSYRREVRASDSPFVERVTLVTHEATSREWSTPDGCWDIVVIRRQGRTIVLQTGLISRPVLLESEAGDSYLSISFKPGIFAPKTPGLEMLDRGLVRPLVSDRAFSMESETLEVPTFENAEGLVDRLVRRGLLARDELVESAADGRARAISPRSMQRHFLSAMGVTPKQFSQIKRACHAVELLERGVAPAAVAAEAGYSDQPHLTRALKAIMGRTPGEILRAKMR